MKVHPDACGALKKEENKQSGGRNILAGNELRNVITGGAGDNSLWGGYSSKSDTLIGGAGKNTFFYGAGNGNDVIRNAHDGGSLTVDGTADVTYQLADGSKYSANHEQATWIAKSTTI